MSFLDLDERLIELAGCTQMLASPLTDFKDFPEADITLVEGAAANGEQLEHIQTVRKRTRILIAFGDCAVTGNVPEMRNLFGVEDVLNRAYRETAAVVAGVPVGNAAMPRLLPLVRRFTRWSRWTVSCRAARPRRTKSIIWSRRRSRVARRRTEVRLMSERIVIHPVTRIEGHARFSIYVSDSGEVESAQFHVTEFRGFEKFCEGRPFHEMPALMSQVCGICPVSHALASAKAGDMLLGVEVPPPRSCSGG
jgi:hypothetical protein